MAENYLHTVEADVPLSWKTSIEVALNGPPSPELEAAIAKYVRVMGGALFAITKCYPGVDSVATLNFISSGMYESILHMLKYTQASIASKDPSQETLSDRQVVENLLKDIMKEFGT
jgi:hypothetical protein